MKPRVWMLLGVLALAIAGALLAPAASGGANNFGSSAVYTGSVGGATSGTVTISSTKSRTTGQCTANSGQYVKLLNSGGSSAKNADHVTASLVNTAGTMTYWSYDFTAYTPTTGTGSNGQPISGSVPCTGAGKVVFQPYCVNGSNTSTCGTQTSLNTTFSWSYPA
jgi:hypothetical protein